MDRRSDSLVKGTLFLNGNFQTFDPRQPHVEALATEGGRIVAIGSSAELRSVYSGFTHIDLGGRAVFPGFVDGHIHLASYGISLRRVELRDARTLAEAVSRVGDAARRARRGEWVRGRGWDKNLWREDRFPTKGDLDPATGDVPVMLSSKDGHLAWVNSSALRLAGINAQTTDPPGGEIARDRRREPTGILKEEAVGLIRKAVPAEDPESIDAGIREAMAVMHRFGIVAVHSFVGTDAFDGAAVFAAYQRLADANELRLRVWMTVPEDNLDAAIRSGLRTGFGNDWLRVGPVKIFADGTLGSQTASMIEPYENQPGNAGIAIHSRAELIDLVGRAVGGGFWCAIHAIGDQANRWVLDAYEAHHEASARAGARHRIEHVQLLHPDDLPRLARLGVTASMQPVHCTNDRDIGERYWGRRSRYAYAWRSLLRARTVLAFGSDAPVETPDVFQGLYAAATRKRPAEPDTPPWYPEETLTMQEAVQAYTLGAATAAGQEGIAGSLTSGKYADFVVLNQQLLAVPAEDILQTRVLATVVGGEIAFRAPEFTG
jgi:predicted amidohydrolase YtcJ